MATIITRSGKGAALSHTEMDANFTNLNTQANQNTNSLLNKQDTLVSGTNLKTVNGVSLLGSGDALTVSDAIDSDSSITVASSKAVKTAYYTARPLAISGSLLCGSSLGTRSFWNTTYEEKKRIYVPYAGTYNVYFSLASTDGVTSYPVKAIIYVNGIAVGIERSVGSGSVSFSQDITVNDGDHISIYCKASISQFPGSVNNFKIMSGNALTFVVTIE